MPDDFDDDLLDLDPTGTAEIAMRRLRRPSWPSEPFEFDGLPEPTASDERSCSVAQAMRTGFVSAARFTCEASPQRFDAFLQSRADKRTLIVHAIDGGPSLPLLLYWTLANVERLTALRVRAKAELKVDVLFVLADDLPASFRKRLAGLGTIRWVTPRYPAGSWRLMPHVAGTSVDHTLTLDAIAAVDLVSACTTAAASTLRPVAFETTSVDGRPLLMRVARGTALHEAGNGGAWSCGPPLATRSIDGSFEIGDGELAFYRETIAPTTLALPCVRCGACVAICPTRVDPVALLHVAANPNHRAAVRAGLDACIQCGLCTAACPSAIPLHPVIDSLHRGLVAREPA